MVYTVTFNPSLDYIMNAENYQEGALNRAFSTEIFPGGKGINVSVMLKNLGIDSVALGFVGGFVGDEIERRLNEMGIKTDFVRLENENSRINVKLKTDSETEINAQGPSISEADMEKLFKKLDKLGGEDFLVLAGSVSAGAGDGIYSYIIGRVPDAKVIVDAEGMLLKNTLANKPFLIKPNHHELGDMFGRVLKTKADVAECAKILCDRGAENVFVSMAGDGGVLVNESGVKFCDAPKGRVVNSTGAGDSAVAGFIAGFIESRDVEMAFVKGLCAGSASAFSKGFATKAEVEDLFCRLEG